MKTFFFYLGVVMLLLSGIALLAFKHLVTPPSDASIAEHFKSHTPVYIELKDMLLHDTKIVSVSRNGAINDIPARFVPEYFSELGISQRRYEQYQALLRSAPEIYYIKSLRKPKGECVSFTHWSFYRERSGVIFDANDSCSSDSRLQANWYVSKVNETRNANLPWPYGESDCERAFSRFVELVRAL